MQAQEEADDWSGLVSLESQQLRQAAARATFPCQESLANCGYIEGVIHERMPPRPAIRFDGLRLPQKGRRLTDTGPGGRWGLGERPAGIRNGEGERGAGGSGAAMNRTLRRKASARRKT